jgi:hypothetical protein
MKASDVKAGDCYRTATNWIRYVETIEEGKVRYRSRGAGYAPGWTSAGACQFQKLQMFAFDVVERVAENWDPSGA